MDFKDLSVMLDKDGPDARQWVVVRLRMIESDETEPVAEASFVPQADSSITISEMRTRAALAAAEVFERAAAILRATSAETLIADQISRRKAEFDRAHTF